MDIKKVLGIITQMKKLNLLEDRAEYDVEELQRCYALTNQEADLLYTTIQSEFSSDYNLSGVDNTLIGETIKEAIHQNLDGWSAECKLIIEAFLSDIALACNK